MKYLKSIGYGVLIWVIIYTVGFITYSIPINFTYIYYYSLIIPIVAIIAFLLARTLNLSSRKEILKYSFTWVIIDIILTYAIVLVYSSNPISNNLFITLLAVFNAWNIVEYLTILLVPIFAIRSN